ncbi:3-dehydroquinate synthase [Brevundimonas sp.]|uniref:3-dehydroquinate synthase n=1 Tax=Brevundimonas sp. TaxID=1871086 RepID=UPI0025D17A57|nr:3-dehydroquinate synthase [Brevundimonas sp.]
MKTIRVTGSGVVPYEVRVGRGLLAGAVGHIAPLLTHRRITIVTDETVAALHGQALAQSLRDQGLSAAVLAVPPGESSKSFAGLEDLMGRLLDQRLDRKDLILALGGGVIGDLTGLAAALYMRGIGFIQAPTTLLAQVDSSVGGKTAIDAPQGKNLIGAFHHPRLVLADLAVLDTLPDRQMKSGMAEILKAGMLGDPTFFGWLETKAPAVLAREPQALERAVARAIEIKAAIVAEDPTEQGRRALLNLGHTFAHAFEAEAGYDEGALMHGEAVALGCALAFRLSARLGLCGPEDLARVERAVAASGLPTEVAQVGDFDPDRLLARMAGDKKAEGGQLNFVLARGIGQAEVVRGVDPVEVRRVLA